MVTAVAMLLSTSCANAVGGDAEPSGPTTTTRVGDPTTLVVGDSILHQALDEVRAALQETGWQPTVLARPGSRIQGWERDVHAAFARVEPTVVVIELGTNNCARGSSCSTIDHAIDDLMAPLASVGRVLWLNVQEAPDYPAGAQKVNAALQAATMRWPNLRIIDFSSAFADRPDLHLPDGVHLSQKGRDAFASFVLEALESDT
jgi:lysophospholipase L1-like esterase